MQRILSVALCAFSFAIAARAQDRKIEISPFAGGYFSSGFQSTGSAFPGIGPSGIVGTPKAGEPNSGIFGVRGSHELTRSLALEGTFGFSPTGKRLESQAAFTFTDIENFLTLTVLPPPRTGNTYLYAANILYELSNRDGWVPFFTAGAGAVTRTASKPAPVAPFLRLVPGDGTLGSVVSRSVKPETQTNLSLNLGGGVKKYLTRRYGIRFDFRSYISQPNSDTVNNMELSFGLIFRL